MKSQAHYTAKGLVSFPMGTTVSERVSLMMDELERDQVQFAVIAGTTKSVVNQWLGGGIKSIAPEYAYSIEKNSGYSARWVMLGDGPKRVEDLRTTAHTVDEESDFAAVRRVKFKISAGISGYSIEYLNGHRAPIFFRKDWLQQRGYNPDKLVAVTVSGASMEPSLFDGDLVVINLDDTKLIDGVSYAANYEGEVVVKRLKRDAGEWWLSSDNQDKRRYPDKRCTDQVFIIGRIVHKQSEHV